MTNLTRRQMGQVSLGSLLTFSLLETIYEKDAFAKEIKPAVLPWFKDVNQLGFDLKDEKITQPQWQAKIEELYAQVNLPELLKFIDFEKLKSKATPPARGARSLRFSFKQIEGAPQKLAYGKQVFALGKGRSVVPHGHNNMATAFIMLSGSCRGRHYDRMEDQKDHIIIKPTIDRSFKPGEYSSITDLKDNVHWFQSETDTAFIFNLHAIGLNHNKNLKTGRVYVDPNGEQLSGGLIRAPRINHDKATKLYG